MILIEAPWMFLVFERIGTLPDDLAGGVKSTAPESAALH